jgi:hypothetical protein
LAISNPTQDKQTAAACEFANTDLFFPSNSLLIICPMAITLAKAMGFTA